MTHGLKPRTYVVADALGIDVPKEHTVDGFESDPAHPLFEYVPERDDHYAFRREVVAEFYAWYRYPLANEPLWICGPHGAGKTSFVKQFFARLAIPVFCAPCNRSTKFAKLLGQRTLTERNGSPVVGFEYGPLARALINDAPLVLDEADRIPPEELVGLNEALESGTVSITDNGGEVLHRRGSGFRVIITGNSSGGHDHTGLYKGIRSHDAALRDRCVFMQMHYPEREFELALLRRRFADLGEVATATLVDIAMRIREVYMGERGTENAPTDLDVTVSTRKLQHIAHYTLLHRGIAMPGASTRSATPSTSVCCARRIPRRARRCTTSSACTSPGRRDERATRGRRPLPALSLPARRRDGQGLGHPDDRDGCRDPLRPVRPVTAPP